MTSAAQNKNLLLDSTQAPKDKQGIIDIGNNCSKCNQLDFLPFTCEYCKKVFCSNHRTLEAHQCPGKGKFEKGKEYIEYHGPTAASLFPDREADKKKINSSMKSPQPSNILEKQFRVGDVAIKTPNAFSKLNKFLNIQQKKKNSSTIGKFFGKSKIQSSNNVRDLINLKKLAKGDKKIAATDKIYVWCLYIETGKSEALETETFEKMTIEKDRKPIFVSRNWPVGRALDSIAENLHIINFNNSSNNSDDRLNIFQLLEEKPKLIDTSSRCINAFKNGDVVYLVKGKI